MSIRLSDIVIHDGCLCQEVKSTASGKPFFLSLCIAEQAEVAQALKLADEMRQYMEAELGGEFHADSE